MKLEAHWDWNVGCVVKVGGNLIREEYVTIGPAIKLNTPPGTMLGDKNKSPPKSNQEPLTFNQDGCRKK